MKRLFRTSILCLGLIPWLQFPLSAEPIKEKSDRICHAFIEHPKDFKDIPTNEDCITESLLTKHGNKNNSCFSHDMNGKPRHFVYTIVGGSCQGTEVYIFPENGIKTPHGLDIRNSKETGWFLGKTSRALDYKGELVVTNNTDDYLLYPSDNGYTLLCNIAYKRLEEKLTTGKNNLLCQSFLSGKYDSTAQDISDRLSQQALYNGEISANTGVTNTVSVDLRNSGKKVKILGIYHSAIDRCGCEINSLGAAMSKGMAGYETDTLVESIDYDLNLLTNNANCGTKETWAAITMDGKGYIAKNIEPLDEDKEDEYANEEGQSYRPNKDLSKTPFPDQVLYRYLENAPAGNHFEEVCRIKSITEKVIDWDEPTLKKHLQYVPAQ